MMRHIHLAAADFVQTNADGDNWTDSIIGATERCLIYKVHISPLAGMTSTVYAWIYDVAGVAASGDAPERVVMVPTTGYLVEMRDGSLQQNGYYIKIATGKPTDRTTTPTGVGNNVVVVRVEGRVTR